MIGRFAPSPTGPLHAGSLAAATASWLDARAHGGRWLLRIEDLDRPREVPGAAEQIVEQLRAHGFRWDRPIVRQSERGALYQAAFERLRAAGWLYPCGCSRREIEEASRELRPESGLAVYPGTCRHGLPPGRAERAWRMRVPPGLAILDDRAVGPIRQDLEAEVGDFVVRRADGLWAYQLAVVVDDDEQGVTSIVRGADLIDSTARQHLLRQALGLRQPTTMHIPLVTDDDGEKLSKSLGAGALDAKRPLPALYAAARHLGLAVPPTTSLERWWKLATAAWAARWDIRPRAVERSLHSR